MNQDAEDRSFQQKRYLDGIKRHSQKGVKILFDGKERSEQTWGELFLKTEDGGHYQGEHVLSPGGVLQEIRFNWISYGS